MALFCRSWKIQGHAFVPGRTGFFSDFRFFASRSDSHHVTGLANDPFKGAGLAFRTFQVHSIIGTHKEFFKYVAAFKTSEFKDGHFPSPSFSHKHVTLGLRIEFPQVRRLKLWPRISK